MTDYQRYPDPRRRGQDSSAQNHQNRSLNQVPQVGQPQPYGAQPQPPQPMPPQRQAANRVGNPSRPPQMPSQQGYQQAYRPVVPPGGYKGYSGATYGTQGQPHNNKNKKGGPWKVIFWIALIVFIMSAVALGVIGYSYWQGQQMYNEIAEEAFVAPSDISSASLEDFEVDWDTLLAINPDTVAWIYIPGTNVNYPIVQSDNNETYLTKDFAGDEGVITVNGTIFLDSNNASNFTDVNSIIYGHHLNDGTMFSAIAAMEDQDAFDASRTIYLLTPYGNYKLTTFSLVQCDADDPLAQTFFTTDDEYTEYVEDKIERSVVEVSDVPDAEDITKTFAFSTCDNLATDGRLVLYAYVSESTVGIYSSSSDDDESTVSDNDPDSVAAVDDAAKEIAS